MTTDRRISSRFSKAFPVKVQSDTYGTTDGVARNISPGGMMVEMTEPLPMGSQVAICFSTGPSQSAMVWHGEVKHQYALNYNCDLGLASCARGIGVRFLDSEHPIQGLCSDNSPEPTDTVH